MQKQRHAGRLISFAEVPRLPKGGCAWAPGEAENGHGFCHGKVHSAAERLSPTIRLSDKLPSKKQKARECAIYNFYLNPQYDAKRFSSPFHSIDLKL